LPVEFAEIPRESCGKKTGWTIIGPVENDSSHRYYAAVLEIADTAGSTRNAGSNSSSGFVE
jgi:hypothetical protein